MCSKNTERDLAMDWGTVWGVPHLQHLGLEKPIKPRKTQETTVNQIYSPTNTTFQSRTNRLFT